MKPTTDPSFITRLSARRRVDRFFFLRVVVHGGPRDGLECIRTSDPPEAPWGECK